MEEWPKRGKMGRMWEPTEGLMPAVGPLTVLKVKAASSI